MYLTAYEVTLLSKENAYFYNLDCHFTAASLKHINDLAGIFGNDCVLYMTQDIKATISIGRPPTKGQSPLIMRLDYETNSAELQSNPTASRHQFTPWLIIRIFN